MKTFDEFLEEAKNYKKDDIISFYYSKHLPDVKAKITKIYSNGDVDVVSIDSGKEYTVGKGSINETFDEFLEEAATLIVSPGFPLTKDGMGLPGSFDKAVDDLIDDLDGYDVKKIDVKFYNRAIKLTFPNDALRSKIKTALYKKGYTFIGGFQIK